MFSDSYDTLPAALARYLWRAPQLQDMPALYEMLIAIDRADQRGANWTLANLQTQFDDPWCNPQHDFRLAFTPEGKVAAMARVFVNPHSTGENRAYLWDEIHPDHRTPELAEFTLNWMETRARQRLQSCNRLPGILRINAAATMRERIALYEQRGYTPVRYFYRMQRDLHQPIPPGPLPPGLTLHPYSSEMDYAVWQVFNEAFQDHWSFEPVSYQEWQMFFTGSSDFRPDLSLVAMESDRIVGLSYNTICAEANERQDVREGWIGELGVLRGWRGRGIATALLCATMRAFQAVGLDYAMLGVDTENPTGALQLYEKLGFKAIRQHITLARPVE